MRLPSIDYLVRESTRTLVRFPGVLLVALVGTIAAIWQVEISEVSELDWTYPLNITIACGLGLPLMLSLILFAQRQGWHYPVQLGLQAVGLLLLTGYYFLLPENMWYAPNSHLVRFFVLNAGLHFLVAFAPFIKQGDLQGFWQYNRILFVRILTAVLYSGVLYLGLVLALLAIDHLLGVSVEDEVYFELWIVIAGLFNTWFFLAGVPEKLSGLDNRTDYPKGLKVFTQYVLIPLVVIYMAILYLYMGKIIVTWSWPEGWVATLVLGFAIAGILALLLVYPIRKKTGSTWIQTFARSYYLILLPLVVLLLLAIWRRIAEYSFTENRYFVLVLAVWLGAISVYFIFSKKKNIKILPVSLCFIALLSSFGPWSAFNVAKKSQLNRLEPLLVKNKILVDGKIRKTKKAVSFEEEKTISSIVRYLIKNHGLKPFQPWLDERADSILEKSATHRRRYYSSYNKTQDMLGIMGIQHIRRWETEENQYENFYFRSKSAPLAISDDAYLLHVSESFQAKGQQIIATPKLDGTTYSFWYKPAQHQLALTDESGALLDFQFKRYLNDMIKEHSSELPQTKLTLSASAGAWKATLHFFKLNIQQIGGDKLKLQHFEGILLVEPPSLQETRSDDPNN